MPTTAPASIRFESSALPGEGSILLMETTSGRSSRIALAHYPAIIKVLTELFDTEVKDASSATPPEELQAEAPAKKRDKPRTVYLEKESPSPEEKPVKRKRGRPKKEKAPSTSAEPTADTLFSFLPEAGEKSSSTEPTADEVFAKKEEAAKTSPPAKKTKHAPAKSESSKATPPKQRLGEHNPDFIKDQGFSLVMVDGRYEIRLENSDELVGYVEAAGKKVKVIPAKADAFKTSTHSNVGAAQARIFVIVN